jgi:hypothetical protein
VAGDDEPLVQRRQGVTRRAHAGEDDTAVASGQESRADLIERFFDGELGDGERERRRLAEDVAQVAALDDVR